MSQSATASRHTLVVTFDPPPEARTVIIGLLPPDTEVVWLAGLDSAARAAALARTSVLLAWHTGKELHAGEAALIGGARLVQFMTAGVDHVPLSQLPPHVPVAGNGGAYAEGMAEHALAMTLAAAKRLLVEHRALMDGRFNQFERTTLLRGATCGILGFGGIGQATARLMRALGMRIHAINRSGRTEEPVDWIGTQDDLPDFLGVCDVLIVSAPLTRRTLGMIGAAELARMKPDAMVVNLARGELIDEAALFAHLRANPHFRACIDAWWVEPVRHGAFRMDHPFLTLPNVIGSPHNSGSVPGNLEAGVRNAMDNVRLVLTGEVPRHLVGPDERML